MEMVEQVEKRMDKQPVVLVGYQMVQLVLKPHLHMVGIDTKLVQKEEMEVILLETMVVVVGVLEVVEVVGIIVYIEVVVEVVTQVVKVVHIQVI